MKKLMVVLLMITLFMTGCTEEFPESGSESFSSIASSVTSKSSENESLQSETSLKTSDTSGSDEEILEKSRNLWKDEYEIMDEYDIDEYQKLATILMASYLDMQVRIDVEGIENLNPTFKDALEDEETRREFIYDLLQCSEFQLQAIEEADMQDGTLTFNVAYRYTYGGNNVSMLFRTFTYQWEEGAWRYYGDTDADPAAARKPNFFLFIDKKEQASIEIFGTDNLLSLFDFKGESYRENYSETYGD